MYRHFATVTVAITALMAFFANGESHKAVAAANTGEQRAMPQPAVSKSQLEMHRDTDLGNWADDEGEVMGQPAIGAYAPSPAPGPQPSALHQDGDEEQIEQGSPAPTASQIAAATDASRLRSGARGID